MSANGSKLRTTMFGELHGSTEAAPAGGSAVAEPDQGGVGGVGFNRSHGGGPAPERRKFRPIFQKRPSLIKIWRMAREEHQLAKLGRALLEKRKRRAEREAAPEDGGGGERVLPPPVTR